MDNLGPDGMIYCIGVYIIQRLFRMDRFQWSLLKYMSSSTVFSQFTSCIVHVPVSLVFKNLMLSCNISWHIISGGGGGRVG